MASRLLIIGAGGHARVIAGILTHLDWDVRGVLDRGSSTAGEHVGPYQVVGTFDDLGRWHSEGIRHVVLALGSNRERATIHGELAGRGFEVVGLRHPSALVEAGAKVADDAVLCLGAIVAAEARVGSNTLLNSGCIVEHECIIGDHAHIGPGARLAGRVRVGVGTFVGLGSSIREKIVVGQGVLVGAGSVVVDDVPDFATVVGSPARVRESIASPWLADE